MTDTLELEFIEEITDEYLGLCDCGHENCNTHRYTLKGKRFPYIINYDPDYIKEEGTNIFINISIPPERAKKLNIMPIRYVGFCKTNMDLATVLKTVIV